jgi:hypothetical protein
MYEGTNDFNVILEDIMKGAIPTNTRMVYPTIWKADRQLLEQQGRLANQQTNQNPLMMGFDYRQW